MDYIYLNFHCFNLPNSNSSYSCLRGFYKNEDKNMDFKATIKAITQEKRSSRKS